MEIPEGFSEKIEVLTWIDTDKKIEALNEKKDYKRELIKDYIGTKIDILA